MAEKEYINRETLLEWAREFYPNDKQLISAVINAPKADMQEIKHAQWAVSKFADDFYRCTRCSAVWNRTFDFCPSCGAKNG